MSDFSHPSNPAAEIPLLVLVVDDEINIRKTLAMCLEADGHTVTAVSNAKDALAESARKPFDLAFVDLKLGSASGLDLIPQLLAQSPWMRIVIITAHASVDSAVETMKRGAADYLTKPFTPAQVKLVTQRVTRLRQLEQQVAGFTELLGSEQSATDLRSASHEMQRAINLARQVAATDTTVLIRGESGTGKGVLARAIHLWSSRAKKPFGIVSCPTLSPQLLESELFGHARGAFTGAVRDNPGRIATSDGGTLFLDEIGDLPLELQPKLLRFAQDRQYERVGEAVPRRADIRLVAATNVDLDRAVAEGKFREDLLYRIKVIQIDLPPLRQRQQDIVLLAMRFLAELKGAEPISGISPDAEKLLEHYTWPGNIRELRNVIERAVMLCSTEQIGPEHLPPNIATIPATPAVEAGQPVSLEKLEEQHIRRVLAQSKSLEEAAQILGIDQATLWRRRKKYGI